MAAVAGRRSCVSLVLASLAAVGAPLALDRARRLFAPLAPHPLLRLRLGGERLDAGAQPLLLRFEGLDFAAKG